jgi:hypothetical protein
MSDSYETTSPSGSDVQSPGTSGKVDAAKQEAADLKDTTTTQAKDVLGTAKDEAASVVGEAKVQAKDLYAQTQKELKEQAGTQQQRLAVGLGAIGDELGTMARNSEGSGVASDLVQQVSTRLASASTWLGERDPSSVLDEVKRFARRRPGTFILGAAIAGIVVGRLTRALAANASDDKQADRSIPALPPAPAPRLVERDPWTATPVGDTQGQGAAPTHNTAPDGVDGAPLYAQTASSRPDILGEDGDERPYAV